MDIEDIKWKSISRKILVASYHDSFMVHHYDTEVSIELEEKDVAPLIQSLHKFLKQLAELRLKNIEGGEDE